MSSDAPSQALCIGCLEEIQGLPIKVADNESCYACFMTSVQPMFEAALRDEAGYPPKIGNVKLNIQDYTHILPKKLVEDYQAKSAEYDVLPKRRVFCAQAYHSSTFLGEASSIEISIQCKDCSSRTCLKCRNLVLQAQHICERYYHPEETTQPMLPEESRGRSWQICPGEGCGALVALEDGCNHVTCTVAACNEQFCFVCGKPARDGDGHWSLGMSCPRYGHPTDSKAIWDQVQEQEEVEDEHARERRRVNALAEDLNPERVAWLMRSLRNAYRVQRVSRLRRGEDLWNPAAYRHYLIERNIPFGSIRVANGEMREDTSNQEAIWLSAWVNFKYPWNDGPQTDEDLLEFHRVEDFESRLNIARRWYDVAYIRFVDQAEENSPEASAFLKYLKTYTFIDDRETSTLSSPNTLSFKLVLADTIQHHYPEGIEPEQTKALHERISLTAEDYRKSLPLPPLWSSAEFRYLLNDRGIFWGSILVDGVWTEDASNVNAILLTRWMKVHYPWEYGQSVTDEQLAEFGRTVNFRFRVEEVKRDILTEWRLFTLTIEDRSFEESAFRQHLANEEVKWKGNEWTSGDLRSHPDLPFNLSTRTAIDEFVESYQLGSGPVPWYEWEAAEGGFNWLFAPEQS